MELPEIDGLLQRASEQLQVGELLHGDSFSMFEAMSAVEIGDPKLDAGVPGNSSPRALPHVPAPAELTSADVIAVADRLFAAEATWHQGAPLAQTVFTCLYLLEPQRFGQEEGGVPLRALCRAVHATSILVRDLILSGNVCEDEDFVIHIFGVQSVMNQRGTDISALENITLAVDLLSGPEPARDAGKAQASGRMEAADVASLLCRLRFRECLLKALQRVQRSTKQDLQQARKLLHLARTHLAEVEKSGHPHPEGAPGFCPDVNRSLMAPVPSKPVMLLSSGETWAAYGKLLDQLLLVCDVSKVASYAELKAFLYDFAARGCGAIARSALHMSFSGKASPPGDLVGPWLPRRPMIQSAVGIPHRALLGAETDLFVEQACLAVGGWCQDMCLNRARQRRRHRRAIEDWFHLSEHAANADVSPGFQHWLRSSLSSWQWPLDHEDSQGPLGCWVEKECACMLLQHLVLGFELDLYAPEEFCMMYWYCDYLYGIAKQDGGRLLQAAASSSSAHETGPRLPTHGKHRKAERQKKQAPVCGFVDTDTLTVEVRHAHLHRQLCQAHMRLAAGLNKGGYLGSLPCLFNSEEERFQQRFAALSVLFRPEPLSYAYYSRSMDMTGKEATEILMMSLEGFHDSRRILPTLAFSALDKSSKSSAGSVHEQNEDYRALDRMAAQNIIAIKVLLNSMLRGGQPQQAAQGKALANGHASAAAEEDRPKPCVPCSEQIRASSPAAASTETAAVPLAPERATSGDSGKGASSSSEVGAFRMEWDFSQHAKYPVMRLKQAGKRH